MPNWDGSDEKNTGDPYGAFFVPNCADFTMRPGCWMWTNKSRGPRTARDLVQKYKATTGSGSKFLLNIAPMDFGGLNATDERAYRQFGSAMECLFTDPVVDVHFNHTPMEWVRGRWEVQWRVDRKLTENTTIRIREDLSLGQRIWSWQMFSSIDGNKWHPVQWMLNGYPSPHHRKEPGFSNQTIGSMRLELAQWWGEDVKKWTTMKMVVYNVTNASIAPMLRDVQIFDWMDKWHCYGEE